MRVAPDRAEKRDPRRTAEGFLGAALVLAGLRLGLTFPDAGGTLDLVLLALVPVLLRMGFDRMLDGWVTLPPAAVALARIMVLLTAAVVTVGLGYWTASPWLLFAAVPLLLIAGRLTVAEIHGGRLL